jgi:chloramphenicol-sensitive protein RarD
VLTRDKGLAANLVARVLWGVAAYYFALSKSPDSYPLFLQRVWWAFVFCALMCALSGTSLRELRACVADRRKAAISVTAALVISTNWFVVLWSVKNGHALDASLGFYMAPIVNVFLGLLVLRETFKWWTAAAVLLCFSGVATVVAGDWHGFAWTIPYIAISSGVYALLRKKNPVPPLAGNLFETGVALVVTTALGLASGGGLPILGTAEDGLLYAVGLGVVTTIPMVFYLYSLDKISLSLNGYLQYLSPTVVFLLAWLVLHEPVPSFKIAGFCLVWSAIVVFATGSLVSMRRASMLKQAAVAS